METHLASFIKGTADGNEAVVNSGLQAGQQVVVAGVHVLSPGQKVTMFQPVGTKP